MKTASLVPGKQYSIYYLYCLSQQAAEEMVTRATRPVGDTNAAVQFVHYCIIA
jgi:hypothetical protein